jgi:hypothetical protein
MIHFAILHACNARLASCANRSDSAQFSLALSFQLSAADQLGGRPFPVEPIRTPDAVHLATTELLGEPPPLIVLVVELPAES